MNVRLLRKVAKHIAAEPRRFIMGGIVQHKLERGDKVYESLHVAGKYLWQFPPCGTAACIAGWSAIIAKKKRIDWSSGRSALRINRYQAERLFIAYAWPDPFRQDFYSATTNRGRVKAAAARIEHFIKTKGKE
jgi:hypothetical protein